MQYLFFSLLYIQYICDKSFPQIKHDPHLQADKNHPRSVDTWLYILLASTNSERGGIPITKYIFPMMPMTP
jgi:hypothetical protein